MPCWAALGCKQFIDHRVKSWTEVELQITHLTSLVEVLSLDCVFLGDLKLAIANRKRMNFGPPWLTVQAHPVWNGTITIDLATDEQLAVLDLWFVNVGR